MKTIFTFFLGFFLFANTLQAQQLDSIFDQSTWRTYIVHLPNGYNANQQYPLVLNLHGLSSNATQQQALSRFNNVADSLGFIVVYPNGTPIAGNANSWSTIGNTEVNFLTNLVDSIRAMYSTNNCLFAMGMSQGGFMTYKFATNTTHSIKAIAVGSGNMSNILQNNSSSAPQIPVMHFHGTADNTVPYTGTHPTIPPVDSTIQWWVRHNNCTTTPIVTTIPNTNLADSSNVEKYYYGGGSNGSEVTFYKVINGGHTWSGGNSLPFFGFTNQDINQSELIGNYFKSFCSPVLNVNQQTRDNNIRIYPNPFGQQLTVMTTVKEPVDFILYDHLSRQVLQQRFSGELSIDTEALARGLYFYELRNAGTLLESGKLIRAW